MFESPFTVLVVAIAFVVVTIVVLRIHAFIALVFAAILAGLLSPVPLDAESALSQPVLALRMTAEEFGRTAGGIGIIIVLASIIGKCLMDSGAAEAITRRFLRLLGRDKSSLALLGSGYVLSVPVFFDTVFYLLVPLAKALRVRTGSHYALYVMAICAGALREYLLRHDALPEAPLRAMVPVSMRGKDQHGDTLGNLVSLIIVELPVDEADPVERLRRIHEMTSELKGSGLVDGAHRILDIADAITATAHFHAT